MSREKVNIPTIRGRIDERLQRAKPRDRQELVFGDSEGEVVLRTPAERGTVALACLVLETIRDSGGTRASSRTLESALKKLLGTMSPKEIMDVEIEAYEMLLWIGKAIDPEWQLDDEILDPAQIDPTAGHTELVQWSIATKQDLELDYYSRNRGELTHRRITPISLEAQTYVHAYCHLRRDERVFRVSRIAELQPVGGWSKIKKSAGKKKTEEAEPDNDAQTNLFGV